MIINKREDVENIDYINEEYCYAWVQEYDRVILDRVSNVAINYDNLIEARIFSTDKELHIFEQNDCLNAVEIIREDGDDYFEEKQILRKRFGKSITMRNYVDYEDDGQAYIVNTVLSDCELQ